MNSFAGINETNAILQKISLVEKAFLEGSKCVVIAGGISSDRNRIADEFTVLNSHMFNNVFNCDYDKHRRIFFDKTSHISVDCIVKKSLYMPFLESCECERINALSEFEACAVHNSLVVVRNYDVPTLSSYLRHLLNINVKLLVVSDCEKEVEYKDCVKVCVGNTHDDFVNSIKERVLSLDENMLELLRSICALVCYRNYARKCDSSKDGVFNEESIAFFTGFEEHETEMLLNTGLVNKGKNGEISIDRETLDFVMKYYTPTLDNCKSLSLFFEECCDFDLIQSAKDIDGKIVAYDRLVHDLAASAEVLCVYTAFCKDDKNRTKRLYNMLMAQALSEVHKYDHLYVNNASFLVRCLEDDMLSGSCAQIYGDSDYFSDFALLFMRINVDLVRICVSLLRGIGYDMYDERHEVLRVLLRSMNRICRAVSEKTAAHSHMLLALDDVISICYEAFGEFEAVSDMGQYNYHFDNLYAKRVGEASQISGHSCCVAMGYSELTVQVYRRLCDIYDWRIRLAMGDNRASFVKMDADSAECARQVKRIRVHLSRIQKGFSHFYDFFEEYNCEDLCAKELSKRLEDNRRLIKRGFDGGTKTGAERYAKEVFSAIGRSKNPARLFCIVMNKDYPVSDMMYKNLCEMQLYNMIADKCRGQERTAICVYLLSGFDAFSERVWYSRLIKNTAEKLLKVSTFDAEAKQHILDAASQMYVFGVARYLETESGFEQLKECTELYEAAVEKCASKEDTTNAVAAEFVYDKLCGKQTIKSAKIKKAFEIFFYEYLTYDSGISNDGFMKLCRFALDRDFEMKMRNIAEQYEKNKESILNWMNEEI